MNILLVYPEHPETFWSYKRALKFINKKSGNPPLGLLTIAAMLPKNINQKLIDLNVTPLRKKHLRWADYVFISAMSIQAVSTKTVIRQCKAAGVPIVAGGPLFTTGYPDYPQIDHFVLNEAEITLPEFFKDLQKGEAKHIYTTDQWADISETPIPRWDLIKMKKYASMGIQFSRGCPFNCDFCDITLLYGHKTRIKKTEQIITELEAIYRQGWRGSVFFVDDNFIGNKKILKKEVLPAIINWMDQNYYPFYFNTQASIDIADDEELLLLLSKAGFDKVFIGLETPHEASLTECHKGQNISRNLVNCVKKIHKFGLEVQGGFIVGFDSDPKSIFTEQIQFIQQSAIVTAMVGMLSALRETKLYHRLAAEKRLISIESGDNTDFSLNFMPKMGQERLMEGYKNIISTIYSPHYYYKRIKTFLQDYQPPRHKLKQSTFSYNPVYISAFLKSILFLGILGKERFYYWQTLLWTIFNRPRLFPKVVTLAIYGYHYRKVFKKYI